MRLTFTYKTEGQMTIDIPDAIAATIDRNDVPIMGDDLPAAVRETVIEKLRTDAPDIEILKITQR